MGRRFFLIAEDFRVSASAATHPDLIVGGGTLKTKSGVLLIVR